MVSLASDGLAIIVIFRYPLNFDCSLQYPPTAGLCNQKRISATRRRKKDQDNFIALLISNIRRKLYHRSVFISSPLLLPALYSFVILPLNLVLLLQSTTADTSEGDENVSEIITRVGFPFHSLWSIILHVSHLNFISSPSSPRSRGRYISRITTDRHHLPPATRAAIATGWDGRKGVQAVGEEEPESYEAPEKSTN